MLFADYNVYLLQLKYARTLIKPAFDLQYSFPLYTFLVSLHFRIKFYNYTATIFLLLMYLMYL